eukprot:gene14713-biopygen21667
MGEEQPTDNHLLLFLVRLEDAVRNHYVSALRTEGQRLAEKLLPAVRSSAAGRVVSVSVRANLKVRAFIKMNAAKRTTVQQCRLENIPAYSIKSGTFGLTASVFYGFPSYSHIFPSYSRV